MSSMGRRWSYLMTKFAKCGVRLYRQAKHAIRGSQSKKHGGM